MTIYINKLEDLIIDTLSDITELPKYEFSVKTRFDDHCLDSIEFSDLIYGLEEKLNYSVLISDDIDLNTISDLAVYLAKKIPKNILNDLDEEWI